MRYDELDRAFGETPRLFAERIDRTLRALKEDKPVKRPPLRAVLIAALILALLCGIACALVFQGQEWYYHNRFTAYQVYEPQKHRAIMEHLQTAPAQRQLPDPLVNVSVQDAAWAPEEKMLTVSLLATPKDADAMELHPMNLDVDGGYVGPQNIGAYAGDEEARAEHWLWTEKGFGPVREMMDDPQKALYLFEADEVFFGPPEACAGAQGHAGGMDSFVGESGAVITVLEIDMPWMTAAYDGEVLANAAIPQAWREERAEQSRAAREALASSVDEKGVLTVSIPYTVTPYVEGDDTALYNGGVTGWVTFQVRVSGAEGGADPSREAPPAAGERRAMAVCF